MFRGLTWKLRAQETTFETWVSPVLRREWIAFQVLGGESNWYKAGYLIQKPEVPVLGEVVVRPDFFVSLREINVYQMSISLVDYRLRFTPEPYLGAVEILLWEIAVDRNRLKRNRDKKNK